MFKREGLVSWSGFQIVQMWRGKTPQQKSRGWAEGSSAPLSCVWLSSEIAASWQISTCSKSVTAHLPACPNHKQADGAKGGERWEVARQEAGKRAPEAPGQELTRQAWVFFSVFLWKKRTFPVATATAKTSKLCIWVILPSGTRLCWIYGIET